MFIKPLSPLLVIAALSGCIQPYETVDVTSQSISMPRDVNAEARRIISRNLFDPEAVRFRDMQAYRLQNGDYAVCGEYNGVNRYGAYVGYERFYLRLRRTAPGFEMKSIKYDSIAFGPCRDLAGGGPLAIVMN